MGEARSNTPLVLSWKDVVVTAGDRILLNHLSGSASGEFFGIMGSTGSGKTTFMNVLAKRISGVKVEGKITINGQNVTPALLKVVSGYVMQDDLLFANLTVEETLKYASILRLPNNVSDLDRKERVDEIIALLGLESCRHTPVGGHLRRGISGGERKRLCVGIELLNRPQFLFLDEPTSGLDSANALLLCSALKQLATSHNCTVICTIHQPQSKIFALFDRVLLLKKGELVYQGPVDEVKEVYARAGYPCPEHMNPADHMLDVITPTSAADTNEVVEAETKLREVITQDENAVEEFEMEEGDHLLRKDFSRISWFKQFQVLFMRSMREQLRDRTLIIAQLIQNVLLAVLIGLVYFQLGNSQRGALLRPPVLFFCVINQGVFSALMIVNAYPSERAITLRERAAGSYNVSAYFLAKSSAAIIMIVIYPIVFALSVYWLVGFQNSFSSFVVFVFLLYICRITSTSLALFVSTTCRTTTLSLIILPLSLEVTRLFGGFYISPADSPIYFIWLDIFSYIKYLYIALSINEFSGLEFVCTEDELVGGVCPITTGEQVLRNFGMEKFTVGYCLIALGAYVILFRFAAFLSLRFLKR